MNGEHYSTWLEIDLGIIKNNIRLLQSIAGCEIMPVVKANAYGHGIIEVSEAAVQTGVTWLGVSRLEEAVALRKAGMQCNILVLGYAHPDGVPQAIAENVVLTVYDKEIATAYAQKAQAVNGCLRIHAKLETGMGRLGYFVEDGIEFFKWLEEQKVFILEGAFTHFARADEPEFPTTNEQLDRFIKFINELEKIGKRPRWVHASNTAAILNYPRANFDLVRPGIGIFGCHPSPQTRMPAGFLPALSWKSTLVSVKYLPPGHGVSYGHRYYTQCREKIGVIAAGYADGFRRRRGNFVLIRGKRIPVVGRVCLDQSMVQLDSISDVKVGDEVVLIGAQNGVSITAEDVGEAWDTVNYEVVCGLLARLPRIFIDN
jgi:alanine racemase